MKNHLIIKTILVGLIVMLFVASCKENKPKGDEFNWSPDGKKLAMVNVESNELLLLDIEGGKINKTTLIDSCSGEKAKIYLPGWSPDGRFLLYAKSRKTAVEIKVYCLDENKTHQIEYIPIDEKQGGNAKVFASWSPKANRILWLSWNSLAEHLLFSALPDGKDKKLLIKLIGEKVFPFPACSPDGEWIAYSVYLGDGYKNNGLWKMKFNGSENQLIFSTNEVTAFEWQPDGSNLAIVQKVVLRKTEEQGNSADPNYHYKLSLIDSNGNNERILLEDKLQIVELGWSPDGKQLVFFEVQDDSRDIWIVNLSSKQKVKLNFNKVQNFYGWDGSGHVFYTTDYPEELVTQTKEQEEMRELLASLKSVQKENLFFKCDNFRQKKIAENIFAFSLSTDASKAAFYKSFQPAILGEEIFFPVIDFDNARQFYPARTRGQHASAADACYLNEKYQDALDHLSQYWDMDLNSPDLKVKFDVDQVIGNMTTDHDSSQFVRIAVGLKNGALLRTVMTLRKLNQAENADWLFDQVKKLSLHIYSSEQDKKDKLDEIFWTLMGNYSRYNEFTSGIQDLDRFLQSEKPDSSLITYVNYTQFVMAFENGEYDMALEKMKTAIEFLPKKLAELNDIADLLMLYRSNFSRRQEAMLVPILHQLINRFPNHKHVSQIYEMLGDLQLKRDRRDEALAAYQSAVVKEFDNHEIWDKILGIK